MSKKHKPKRGWEPSGFYSFPYLSEENFAHIAEVLHAPEIPEDLRSQLQDAVRDYLSDKNYLGDIPRSAEVRAALVEVRDKAHALDECLKELDDVSLYALERTKAYTNVRPKDTVEDHRQHIRRVFSAAKEALEVLGQDKGGRPKQKAALRNFIGDLKVVFEQVTGSKATVTWNEHKNRYAGSFFDFVHSCLQIVDPEEIYSNSSLGQQIKQALALAKSNLG